MSNIKFEIIESEHYYVKKYENGWFEAWAKTTVNSGDFSFIAFGGTSVLYRARFTNFGFGIKATEVYDMTLEWALAYDKDFALLLEKYKDYSTAIFNIEREQKKPRKDIGYFGDVKNQIWYMYDELFFFF